MKRLFFPVMLFFALSALHSQQIDSDDIVLLYRIYQSSYQKEASGNQESTESGYYYYHPESESTGRVTDLEKPEYAFVNVIASDNGDYMGLLYAADNFECDLALFDENRHSRIKCEEEDMTPSDISNTGNVLIFKWINKRTETILYNIPYGSSEREKIFELDFGSPVNANYFQFDNERDMICFQGPDSKVGKIKDGILSFDELPNEIGSFGFTLANDYYLVPDFIRVSDNYSFYTHMISRKTLTLTDNIDGLFVRPYDPADMIAVSNKEKIMIRKSYTYTIKEIPEYHDGYIVAWVKWGVLMNAEKFLRNDE